MSVKDLTVIEGGRIQLNDEMADINDLVKYCEAECDERCQVPFATNGIECDCVVNRFYWAMVRVANLEHGEGESHE